MPAALASPLRTPSLESLLDSAPALYSLPAVAVEVLRLTDNVKVDVRALKECIERDPALTVKLLRVVNSSLFGLSREVGDLNQAIALLGIKPLKLLVLGFSLPEELFAAAARGQLEWYWNTTLARAVAARELGARSSSRDGDDAFLAGLLSSLGVLVLLAEMGPPYADLLREATTTGIDLRQLERDVLGYDHVELTAALLAQWNMPPQLVEAIRAPRIVRQWAKNRAAIAPLVRTLHLADLLGQLVGERRLNVLPDLLEACEAYCGMDRAQLNELVAELEPKVRQLASALSLGAVTAVDYSQALKQAHEQMARLGESVAATLSGANVVRQTVQSVGQACQPDKPASRAVPDAASPSQAEKSDGPCPADRLRAQFDKFFKRPRPERTTEKSAEPKSSTTSQSATPRTPAPPPFAGIPCYDFDSQLTLAAGQCRAQRDSLSVIVLGVRSLAPLHPAQRQRVEQALDAAARIAAVAVETPMPLQRVLVMGGCDRLQAVAAARTAVDSLRKALTPLIAAEQLPPCASAAGAATVTAPAKNFEPRRLVETAQRCAAAALTTGGVKSLEVS